MARGWWRMGPGGRGVPIEGRKRRAKSEPAVLSVLASSTVCRCYYSQLQASAAVVLCSVFMLN